MARVFVIMGECGEYSDRTTWLVAAYDHETLARRHVELASIVARGLQAQNYTRYSFHEPPATPPNPYDPAMLMFASGTTYAILTAELRQQVPEVTN